MGGKRRDMERLHFDFINTSGDPYGISREEWIRRFGSDEGFDDYDLNGDVYISYDEWLKGQQDAFRHRLAPWDAISPERLLEHGVHRSSSNHLEVCCCNPPCRRGLYEVPLQMREPLEMNEDGCPTRPSIERTVLAASGRSEGH